MGCTPGPGRAGFAKRPQPSPPQVDLFVRAKLVLNFSVLWQASQLVFLEHIVQLSLLRHHGGPRKRPR